MFGFWRSADLMPLRNERVSVFTSRWINRLPFELGLLLSKRYSIGCSMVTIVTPIGSPVTGCGVVTLHCA